ncbi:hypothetical protein [Prosthecodimorpha staleyi]|uniref:Uncharacterized protein n=1 Tax=Prosthecodimorpha staleyi TaxID=2840188 RepID=A0A947DCM8_9HYPH|nr:hypothetical protein [Prosthecodimorpha staleyi]MBT9292394.1 hypothetical protein [Prosthecodimorpha staleyi]
MTFRTTAALALLALSLGAGAARAEVVVQANSLEAGAIIDADPASAEDRLLIVNGNSGRVIYDDGRNDLFCVTRVVFSYYDHYGRPHYRRTMRCR